MRASRVSRSALPAALAALLATALLVLVPATSASAHDQLIGSDPASDSQVETLPEQISLTFSDAVFDAPDGTAIEVADESGRVVSDGAPEIEGAIVRQNLDTAGAAAGEYTVRWAIVSADGHPTGGEYGFSVASGTAASASPTPLETGGAETDDADAEPSAQPTAEQSAPAVDDQMEAGFALSVPWMVAIAVIAILLIALVIVLVSRRRGPQNPDSDARTER